LLFRGKDKAARVLWVAQVAILLEHMLYMTQQISFV